MLRDTLENPYLQGEEILLVFQGPYIEIQEL